MELITCATCNNPMVVPSLLEKLVVLTYTSSPPDGLATHLLLDITLCVCLWLLLLNFSQALALGGEKTSLAVEYILKVI